MHRTFGLCRFSVPSCVLIVTILLNWRDNFIITIMDRNRTVAGLDVQKDSIYLCIMGHDEAIKMFDTRVKDVIMKNKVLKRYLRH